MIPRVFSQSKSLFFTKCAQSCQLWLKESFPQVNMKLWFIFTFIAILTLAFINRMISWSDRHENEEQEQRPNQLHQQTHLREKQRNASQHSSSSSHIFCCPSASPLSSWAELLLLCIFDSVIAHRNHQHNHTSLLLTTRTNPWDPKHPTVLQTVWWISFAIWQALIYEIDNK